MLYYFELGREQPLALSELLNQLPEDARYIDGAEQVVIIEAPESISVEKLQERLGGTVKIGVIEQTSSASSLIDDVLAIVKTYLGSSSGRRNIGISVYGKSWRAAARNTLCLRLKKRLKSDGLTARFILNDEAILSSVIVSTQLVYGGRELSLIVTDQSIYLGYTLTCQAWREWSHLDYDRPIRDPYRGMLPPKLARMMLNLLSAPNTREILDPFCGIGTVLQEARRIGIPHLYGADRDEKAIEATATNLAWLEHELSKTSPYQPSQLYDFVQPIETLVQHLASPVQAIVTEADLGPANLQDINPDERIRTFSILRQSYARWIPLLASLLTPQGEAIIALPILRAPSQEIMIEELCGSSKLHLDELIPNAWRKHPSIRSSSPITKITYAREHQVIGRQIVRLKKT